MSTPRPHGLYLPDGSFKPFDAEALTTELATRERAGDFLALAGGFLGVLPDPDPVLRARGEDASALADIAADDQVTTAMLSRKYRVLNRRDYALSPGQPKGGGVDPDAELLCEQLTEDMERWDMAAILAGILDAPFFGMAPLELLWKAEGDWWRLVDVSPRPPEWFGYNEHNELVWRGETMATASPLPVGKYVVARHFPTYRNPYGLRLLARCLWPVAFKKGGVTFYTTFLEKYGMPWAVGTAPAKATREEKRAMAADLARMVQDAVAVIPYGASVSLETVSGQVGDLHEAFLRRWDASISKVLMGQTLTTELEGKNNSQAAAETHKGVADDIAEADRRMVEAAMNEIAWLYAQVNRPGALAPLFAYAEPEDLKAKADLDKTLSGIGVGWKAVHFERAYGLDPDEFELRQPAMPDAGNPGAPAEFAAAPAPGPARVPEADPAQTGIEEAITRHLPKVLAANAQFISQVENAVQQAESWEDMQLLLAELLGPSVEASALEDLLAELMLSGAAYGRAAVHAETGGGHA